ncbi:UNVERIFIED_CONTAM: hypothetical protein GTU68_062063 [Idotea baltica]|nr:hypothetical protein [Idotea baltica]
MKSGKVVERNETQKLFSEPQETYTQELLSAVPSGAKNTDDLSKEGVLLKVDNLTTSFLDRNSGTRFKAVDDVSFDIRQNEILGLVGESGSGKSTIGRSILKLVRAESGSVIFDDKEILIQMIFQDPYASLNPRMTVYDALAEPLIYHKLATRSDVDNKVLELMDDVGLARAAVKKYPHEFSGGQRQRIAIGRAIATRPQLIIADEPVSALDVTIQKQILELLTNLVQKHNLTMLFVSHDLSVVRSLCDRVMVIQHGKLVETADTEELWQTPQRSYTQNLLAAIPQI